MASRLESLVSHALVAGTSAALATYCVHELNRDQRQDVVRMAREALPKRIILMRHGQSEGNVDPKMYWSKVDNRMELTDEGGLQARAAGKRIKELIGEESLDLYVSPFQRTLQTSRNVILAFPEGQVKRVCIDPRIREQEFGNLQGDHFAALRQEQVRVGRFWYRFPTGESGADVYDRTSQWWESEVMSHNLKPGLSRIDNILVVSHGLTIRLILMQLFGWSVDTFHTVWNAENCQMFVLNYDPSLTGRAPYRISAEEGDAPRSSAEITVILKGGESRNVVIEDYLSIPPPRTEQHEYVKRLLHEQHGIHPYEVGSINFFPSHVKKFM